MSSGNLVRVGAALLVASMLAACGPKVKISPDAASSVTTTAAILPPTYVDGVQRERIDYLQQLLRAELKNDDFFLLDDRIVRAVCRTEGCPERTKLAERYGATTFFELNIRSTSAINFLAGYYNALDGSLRATDAGSNELFRIDYTERERGGVVFESGQVLQGIISQVNNGSQASEDSLGGRFIRKLVGEVPHPGKQPDVASSRFAASIDQWKITTIRPSVREVCVTGSPNAVAVLQVGDRKSTLREVSPGQYCGIFRFDDAFVSTQKVVAELRSPFGSGARRDVDVTAESATVPGQSSSARARRL